MEFLSIYKEIIEEINLLLEQSKQNKEKAKEFKQIAAKKLIYYAELRSILYYLKKEK